MVVSVVGLDTNGGRSKPASSFRTPRSGDPESSYAKIARYWIPGPGYRRERKAFVASPVPE